MAWRRPGDKPLSEPMMVRLPTHICVTQPQWVNTVMKCWKFVNMFWLTDAFRICSECNIWLEWYKALLADDWANISWDWPFLSKQTVLPYWNKSLLLSCLFFSRNWCFVKHMRAWYMNVYVGDLSFGPQKWSMWDESHHEGIVWCII